VWGPKPVASADEPGAEKLRRIFGRAGHGQSPIDWVNLRAVPGLRKAKGRLGMTWLAQVLRDLPGVDRVVLLVEDHELAMAGVTDIGGALARNGVGLVRYPILDRGLPVDEVAFGRLLGDIRGWVAAGESVAVSCFGGLGRTGTVVACVLREAGLDAESAIGLTRATRPGTIETLQQEDFVRRHAVGAPDRFS
jgi:hypothetical protein